MRRNLSHGAAGAVMVCLLAGCTERAHELTPRQSGGSTPGPVVARVGDTVIRADEVQRLAAFGHELSVLAGVEAEPAGGDLDRAIEFVALAQAARISGMQPDEKGVSQLLARVLLERQFGPSDAQESVTDEEIIAAHEAEIARFRATGESELYAPARMSAVIIGVGYFPDLHPIQPNERPVLDEAAIHALIERIATEAGKRVADLDAFLQLGRRWTAGHPTVRVLEYNLLPFHPRFAQMEPGLREALQTLARNGDVSSPIYSDRGAMVVRRGFWDPGRGEDWRDIRSALRAEVLAERRKQRFAAWLEDLEGRTAIRIWPERLAGSERRPAE